MDIKLAFTDILIIVSYLILTLYIGWRASRKVNDYEDFSLGGRDFGPFMLAATFGATNFSTWSLVGKPGMVYSSGISVVWIAMNAMACVLAAVVFVPIYRKVNYTTMSEIFEDRYDGKVRSLISLIWIIADTLNRFGVTIYASAVILGLLLGIPLNTLILLISVTVLIYTLMGGLRAVVITDAVQFVFMWVGLFIGAIFIFNKLGGWSGLANSIPNDLLEIVPSSSKSTGWPWILAMSLLGFPYFITSQFVMQRGLASKTVNVAKWGMIIAGIIAIPMAIMEVIPGLAANALLSDTVISNLQPDMIGPQVYIELLPTGLLGLFFAAMLAAGFSTADSALCSSSSLITQDFYRKWKPDLKEKEYLKFTRISTVVLALVGTLWATLIPLFGGALNAILNVVAITDMPIFVIVCLGVFWKKMNASAALIAILGGTIAGVIASVTGLGGIQGLAMTTLASTGTSILIAIVISMLTKKTDLEIKGREDFFAKLSE